MSITVKANAGAGEPCACGNHRSKCRFGRMHSWQTPFYKDGVDEMQHTFWCYQCGAECLTKREGK